MKQRIRLISFMLAIVLLAPDTLAQTLLFRSGFEANTVLEPIPSSAVGDDYQHFSAGQMRRQAIPGR